jgi:flavin-dependent dehydrogenase
MAFGVTRDKPLVSMTMRSVLDETLTNAAVAAGAEMESGRKVTHLDQQPDSVTLVAGDRTYRAQFVIAADGAAGPTATLSAWGQNPNLIPALESEIRTDAGTLKRFSDVARFDFGLVPSGYAWVFPKRDRLSVGCLSFCRHKPELQRHLAAYLRLLDIELLQTEDHGFVIPVSPRANPLARGRVLLTGDSAGLADPVTCEGISNAILSGRLAAKAIAVSGPLPEQVSSTYQRSLEESILGELRLSRILAGFLYRSPRLSRFAFRRLGQSLSEAMADIISGDRTYRELLSSPKGYFHVLGRLLGLRGTYPKG